MALDLWNRFELAISHDGQFHVTAQGVDADMLPRSAENRVIKAAAAVFQYKGQKCPGLTLQLVSAVPIGRGLGSSATATLAGILAADHLTDGGLKPCEALNLATALEGHADNLAAALYGGITLTWKMDHGYETVRLPFPKDMVAVLAIPDRGLATEAARAALPSTVPLADALFNVGRVSLMVASLTLDRRDWLRQACEDRLHQPYRQKLIPGFKESVKAALDAGAFGACLSGSGSAILALTGQNNAQEVADAMRAAWVTMGVGGHTAVLTISDTGARINGRAGDWV